MPPRVRRVTIAFGALPCLAALVGLGFVPVLLNDVASLTLVLVLSGYMLALGLPLVLRTRRMGIELTRDSARIRGQCWDRTVPRSQIENFVGSFTIVWRGPGGHRRYSLVNALTLNRPLDQANPDTARLLAAAREAVRSWAAAGNNEYARRAASQASPDSGTRESN